MKNQAGAAEEWSFVFVGREEREFRCLELDFKDHFFLLSELLEEALRRPLNDAFRFFAEVWYRHV